MKPSFKVRWRRGDLQIGIFTRLTTPDVYETLALAPLDVIVMDAEHGAFDRENLGRCLFAARSGGLPVLVRVPDPSLPAIQYAIGAGAEGVIVPHVASAGEMEAVARFVHGLAIERAFAGATRVSRGRQIPWPDLKRSLDERVALIAQIDEPPGIAAAAEIVALDGVDGVFLGRIGLALAMAGQGEPEDSVDKVLETVCSACAERKVPIGISLPDEKTAQHWRTHGVNLFVVDSDQSLLLKAVQTRTAAYKRHLTGLGE